MYLINTIMSKSHFYLWKVNIDNSIGRQSYTFVETLFVIVNKETNAAFKYK